MSTDAQTLVSAQAAAGYEKLSERELDECLIGSVTSGTPAQVLLSGAVSGGFDRLSCRELKECLLAVASPPAVSAQTLLSTAVSEGYEKLSERELKECTLAAASGGGPPPPAKFWTPTSFPLEADLGFTLGVTNLNTFAFSDSGNLVGLLTVAFPMVGASNIIDFDGESTLLSVTGNSITSLNSLILTNCSNLTNVGFSSLNHMNGDVDISNNAVITVDFSSLQVASGNLQFAFNQIASISLPVLVTMGGDFNLHDDLAVTSISLPSLSMVGNITTVNDASLTTLNCPALTSLFGGNFNCPFCPLLTTVNIGSVIIADFGVITFDSCALNAASINAILRRCVVSNLQNSDIELANGTNAAPTGQGLLDKATLLLSPGNTVNTN